MMLRKLSFVTMSLVGVESTEAVVIEDDGGVTLSGTHHLLHMLFY